MQGVCADCWGSKGGRQFWLSKKGPSSPADEAIFDSFSPIAIGAVVASLPALGLVLLWILG